MEKEQLSNLRANIERRKLISTVFSGLGLLIIFVSTLILFILIAQMMMAGLPRITPQFFTSFPSRHPEEAGILSAWVGTTLVMFVTTFIAVPLGVASGIYLEEYSRKNWIADLIEINVTNLAGVPSIVFGLFGFGLFVLFAPVIGAAPVDGNFSIPLGICYLNFTGWGVSLLSGWFTLAFMVLPVVITASEESLKAVPKGFRDGSLALGATQWEAIRTNVLPYALPGILTSSILGIARVAGETAPIMFTAAYVVRDRLPWQVDKAVDVLFQGVMALPYHIYVVSSKIPQNEYTERVQFGTAFVFLAVVLSIALSSVILRNRMRARYRW
jgi:phosphate transport system permease protein